MAKPAGRMPLLPTRPMICTQSDTKSHQVNEAQRAQEYPANQVVSRRFNVPPPGQARQEGEEPAAPGDDAVAPFGDMGEDGRVIVPIEQPLLMRVMGQRPEDRLGAAIDSPIRLNQLHGVLELAARHFGKARRHLRSPETAENRSDRPR